MPKLTIFSFPPPGLGGVDKVVPDWDKIQFFVSVQVRSFLSDVDGLTEFSGENPINLNLWVNCINPTKTRGRRTEHTINSLICTTAYESTSLFLTLFIMIVIPLRKMVEKLSHGEILPHSPTHQGLQNGEW